MAQSHIRSHYVRYGKDSDNRATGITGIQWRTLYRIDHPLFDDTSTDSQRIQIAAASSAYGLLSLSIRPLDIQCAPSACKPTRKLTTGFPIWRNLNHLVIFSETGSALASYPKQKAWHLFCNVGVDWKFPASLFLFALNPISDHRARTCF